MGCRCNERREMGRRVVSAVRNGNLTEARRQIAAMSSSAVEDVSSWRNARVMSNPARLPPRQE